MTDVLKNDYTPIASIDDVIALYQGNKLPVAEQYIGMETEICLYKIAADGKPVAASPADCAALMKLLQERGHVPQLEMASAVEYASPAVRIDQIDALCREVRASWRDYQQAINDLGLIASDSALLPFATLDSARKNLVDRDRARGLVKGMSQFKEPEFLKVTLLCTSTQVSLSYADADDLFDTLKLAYALTPVIYGLFANHPAFVEGKPERLDHNPRATWYEAFGKDGGIPQSLLDAKDGQDFIRRHAQQVFDTEMLFYYDAQGETVWPERPVKFSDLAGADLNTRSNYDLAETFIYTDMKVCNIRDENGTPTGKRIEVRGLDAGQLGVFAGVPFVHAVLRDDKIRDAVQGLLLAYGIDDQSPQWGKQIKVARHAAAHHDGKFLDVPFGNGKLGDFCRDLLPILRLHAAAYPALADSMAPLHDLCGNAKPLAQLTSEKTPTYDSALYSLRPTANSNHLRAAFPSFSFRRFGG